MSTNLKLKKECHDAKHKRISQVTNYIRKKTHILFMIFVFVSNSGGQHVLIISVTWRASSKKQELLILREHINLPQLFVSKITTQSVLDATMRNQVQITQIKHEPSSNKLEVKSNRISFLCGNRNGHYNMELRMGSMKTKGHKQHKQNRLRSHEHTLYNSCQLI
jgi:hypothetical protein